jgi:hypothetical protein
MRRTSPPYSAARSGTSAEMPYLARPGDAVLPRRYVVGATAGAAPAWADQAGGAGTPKQASMAAVFMYRPIGLTRAISGSVPNVSWASA